jgi:diaminopropionate ammonia-lyase
MPRILVNPLAVPGLVVPPPEKGAIRLHRRLPGYQPTPLRSLPALARRLRLGAVEVKDESSRLGLPAYKVLGAVWAVSRALGHPGEGLEVIAARLGPRPALRLVTATDGNHGRGVARVGRWLGVPAEIYLPAGTAQARLRAIQSEGARTVEVPGTYDDAVARAAATQGPEVLLIQDHGWPGYEEIPGWVAEGYETIFTEIAEARATTATPDPDVVLVQIGVGTLAAAALRHFRAAGREHRPALVGVEPTGAACALQSIEAGHRVMIPAGTDASIMAGLNCGTPSSTAWPLLRDGMDAFVAVEDEQAREAMRLLAEHGVVAGESGAAGLAGLLELLEGESSGDVSERLGLGPGARVLLLVTEGATDPEAWSRITGRRPD